MHLIDEKLEEGLNYKKYPELEKYFAQSPFISILTNKWDNIQEMILIWFISNLTTRFWRILKTNIFLSSSLNYWDMCEYWHEIFLNQVLSYLDALSSLLNKFMSLWIKNERVLWIQNDNFHKNILSKLEDYPYIEELNIYHNWVKEKIYPYRNILHHKWSTSTLALLNENFEYKNTLVMSEDSWDFKKLKDDLNWYAWHMDFLIATNALKVTNRRTGEPWDEYKYIKIDDFFSNYIDKVFKLSESYIKALVWFQENK